MILCQAYIEMKLPIRSLLLKDSHEKKDETPTFWLGLLLFIKGESLTPAFKILVRSLINIY